MAQACQPPPSHRPAPPASPWLLLLQEASGATHTGRHASWLAHGPSRTLVKHLRLPTSGLGSEAAAASGVRSSPQGAAVSVGEKGLTPGPVHGSKITSESFMQRKSVGGWRRAQGRGLGKEESVAGGPGERALPAAAHADPGVRDEPAVSGELPAGCVAEREMGDQRVWGLAGHGPAVILSWVPQSFCLLKGF